MGPKKIVINIIFAKKGEMISTRLKTRNENLL